VIKPAGLTPPTTLFLADLLREAGLPPGVLNVVTTSASAPVSNAIVADKRQGSGELENGLGGHEVRELRTQSTAV
jgi:hypothetical protein